MESSPRNAAENAVEKIKKHLYTATVNQLRPDFEKGGFGAVGSRVLETAHINPRYVLEETDAELFKESRLRLQKEAGLIIANHPGHYDTYLILNTLNRNDVKIVVSEENYDVLSTKLGSESFIKATRDPREALSFLREIKGHIEEGGVVILYPSGGGEKDGDFSFEPGFAAIIKRCLQPNDMVYTFAIEPGSHDQAAQDKMRAVGAASSIISNDFINPNKNKDDMTIAVHEKYTSAEQWHQALEGTTSDSREANLTQFFKQQMSES